MHVKGLAEALVQQGHSVTVVTLGQSKLVRTEKGVKVVTLRRLTKLGGIVGVPGLGSYTQLKKIVQDDAIELISTHTRFFLMSYLGMLVAKFARIPLIHTEHGSDYVRSESRVVRGASKLVDTTIGKKVLRASSQILGVSEESCAFVHKLAGVEAKVFYNAILPSTTPKESIQFDPSHFVFVGRIVEGKGWREFLELISLLQKSGEQISASILGGGAQFEEMQSSVVALKLNEKIDIRGAVSSSEVRQTLRGAVLVNPTSLSEGFQTTLLEALDEGGIVLTYPVPGAEKLREEGAQVFIVKDRAMKTMVRMAQEIIVAPDARELHSMTAWTWPRRSAEFAEICLKLLRSG